MDTAHGIKQSVSGKANNNLLNQIIGKTVTYGKLGLGGMILLLALHLWLAPAYGSGTITENFVDNQYNTDLWSLWSMGEGVSVQVANNRLEGTVSGNGYAGLIGWGFTLIGDFEMRVDFTLLNWPDDNGTQITIGTNNASYQSQVQVGRAKGIENREIYFTVILAQYADTPVTGPVNGKLRMVRTGNRMEGFYWNGTGWQSIGSSENTALGSRAAVSLSFGPYGGTYSGISAQAAFSNIQIDYTTLGPGFGQGNAGPGIMLLMFD